MAGSSRSHFGNLCLTNGCFAPGSGQSSFATGHKSQRPLAAPFLTYLFDLDILISIKPDKHYKLSFKNTIQFWIIGCYQPQGVLILTLELGSDIDLAFPRADDTIENKPC